MGLAVLALLILALHLAAAPPAHAQTDPLAAGIAQATRPGSVIVRRPETRQVAAAEPAVIPIPLAADGRYAFVAACAGPPCTRVEVQLLDAGRRAVTARVAGATVTLEASATAGATYALAVSAPGCGQVACAVAIAVLGHAGAATAAAAAPASPQSKTQPQPQEAAAKPAGGPSGFTTFDNHDMYGGDLARLPNVDAPACADRCRAEKRCVAFSYDKWNRWCFLKEKLGPLLLTARSATSLRADQGKPAFSDVPTTFERLPGRAFPQRSFPHRSPRPATVATRDACEATCKADEACIAYTFERVSRACHSLPTTDAYTTARDADSGAKVQRPAEPRP